MSRPRIMITVTKITRPVYLYLPITFQHVDYKSKPESKKEANSSTKTNETTDVPIGSTVPRQVSKA